MKVNSGVRSLKKNLIILMDASTLNYKPNNNVMKEKFKLLIDSVSEILERGNIDICYQELYNNVNDLLLFDIPPEYILAVEELFKNHSKTITKLFIDLVSISNINSFFQSFNSIWVKISNNFTLLKKILTKFEKKIYNRNFGQNGIWCLCK